MPTPSSSISSKRVRIARGHVPSVNNYMFQLRLDDDDAVRQGLR